MTPKTIVQNIAADGYTIPIYIRAALKTISWLKNAMEEYFYDAGSILEFRTNSTFYGHIF